MTLFKHFGEVLISFEGAVGTLQIHLSMYLVYTTLLYYGN